MPSKKKDLAAELQSGVTVEEVAVMQEEEKAAAKLCGHINRQYYSIDGVLEDLPCDLPKGHAGDHSAKTKQLVKNPYPTRNPDAEYRWVAGADYEIKVVAAFWSDVAGTPADQIKPDYEGLTREQWVNKQREKRLAEAEKGNA